VSQTLRPKKQLVDAHRSIARALTHIHTIANNQQVDVSIREEEEEEEEEEAKDRITKGQRCFAFTNKKDASTQSKG
jgi:predicted RNA-binding protein with RPS1 domain